MGRPGKAKSAGKRPTSRPNEIFSVQMRKVRLEPSCRRLLKKIKNWMWGNVADAVELPEWFVPVESHSYGHMKEILERRLEDFFDLEKSSIAVKSFETDIISYE